MLKKLFLILSLFVTSSVTQSHQKITDLTDILMTIPAGKMDVLVIFDVDMVLLMPRGPVFSGPCLKKHRHIYKKVLKYKTPLAIDTYANSVISKGNLVAVLNAKNLLQTLRDKNIATVALTAASSGILGGVDLLKARLRNFSAENLKVHDPYAPDDHIFENLPSTLDGHPMVKNHILFTNGQRTGAAKSVVLEKYLEQRSQLPDHIIFIDDRQDNLDDIAAFMAKSHPNIPLTPLHFLGAFIGKCEVSAESFESTLRNTTQRPNSDLN